VPTDEENTRRKDDDILSEAPIKELYRMIGRMSARRNRAFEAR